MSPSRRIGGTATLRRKKLARGEVAAICLLARARLALEVFGAASMEASDSGTPDLRVAAFFAVGDLAATGAFPSRTLARVRFAGALAFLGLSGFIPWVWDDYRDRDEH